MSKKEIFLDEPLEEVLNELKNRSFESDIQFTVKNPKHSPPSIIIKKKRAAYVRISRASRYQHGQYRFRIDKFIRIHNGGYQKSGWSGTSNDVNLDDILDFLYRQKSVKVEHAGHYDDYEQLGFNDKLVTCYLNGLAGAAGMVYTARVMNVVTYDKDGFINETKINEPGADVWFLMECRLHTSFNIVFNGVDKFIPVRERKKRLCSNLKPKRGIHLGKLSELDRLVLCAAVEQYIKKIA